MTCPPSEPSNPQAVSRLSLCLCPLRRRLVAPWQRQGTGGCRFRGPRPRTRTRTRPHKSRPRDTSIHLTSTSSPSRAVFTAVHLSASVPGPISSYPHPLLVAVLAGLVLETTTHHHARPHVPLSQQLLVNTPLASPPILSGYLQISLPHTGCTGLYPPSPSTPLPTPK